RRGVGDIAADRPRIANLNRGKAPKQLAEIWVKSTECRGCFPVAYSRADAKAVRRLLDLIESGHAGHVDKGRESPLLLRYPKPDVLRSGDRPGIGVLAIARGELANAARRKPSRVTVPNMQHVAVIESGKSPRGHRLRCCCRAGRGRDIEAGVYDRTVAGAAAKIAGEPVLDAL